MSIISLKNVSKFYRNKTSVSTGFSRVNLTLDMGEFVVITGESGSGKSTLLNVISGLDSYEEGEMYINGEETSHYTEVDYENYRRKYIGNIFQHFNLVNSYTVKQNVELALLLNGYDKKTIVKKTADIIETVGLSKYKNTKASKLSGGQKQRVAIARALAKDTPIIVADEPTGNLDVKSAKSIMKLLSEISLKKLVVIVTHNYDQVEEYATRKIAMSDGKIIEDKRLKKYEKCDAELASYDNISWGNKIKLGLRNAFNIKAKFVLLFLVYFFLTVLVFSEYSGLQKQDFSDSLEGLNGLFYVNEPNRVIVNKKDKTAFTKNELDKLRALENVSSLEENDTMLDMTGSIYDTEYDFYLTVAFRSKNELDAIDFGTKSEEQNEIVIGLAKDAYNKRYLEELFKKDCILQLEQMGDTFSKIKVTGIEYTSEASRENYVYLSPELFEEVKTVVTSQKNEISMEIDSVTVVSAYNSGSIKMSKRVKEGEIFIPSFLEKSCNSYNCANSYLKMNISNMYYEESGKFKIAQTISMENYKMLLGNDVYDFQGNSYYLNPHDYERLFEKGDYQISLFLQDIKSADETLKFLEDTGYNYYFMKDNLIDASAQYMGMLKIIRNVIFITATVALFFISYFIIKIILKSRNVYFSTIRILGATKKVSRHLLNIELLIDINVAYLVFVVLVLLTKTGVLSFDYIQDMVTFFTFRDYIAVYVILLLMSLLISNRYAHKLFADSVMNTYREEV